MAGINLPGGLSIGGDTLGYAGAGSALLGGIVGAIGASDQAAGTAASLRAQAQGYGLNAEIAGENAGQANTATAINQRQQDYNANKLIGRQRAAYGAAGLSGGSGSPLDVLADTEEQISQAAKNQFYTGATEARNAGNAAGFDRLSQQAALSAAGRADSSAGLGIFSSILGGAGSAAKIMSFI